MAATYTFDVFSTLDGYGSPRPGTWGGYWGKSGPGPDGALPRLSERGLQSWSQPVDGGFVVAKPQCVRFTVTAAGALYHGSSPAAASCHHPSSA